MIGNAPLPRQMDGDIVGINAFFVLNYALPGMAFEPGFGLSCAGRRRVCPLRIRAAPYGV
jgi:hypothetical protein